MSRVKSSAAPECPRLRIVNPDALVQYGIDEDIAWLGVQRPAIVSGRAVYHLGCWAEQRCTGYSIDVRQPEAGISDRQHGCAGRQRSIALVPEQAEQVLPLSQLFPGCEVLDYVFGRTPWSPGKGSR